ncbi:hypothetical protein EVAR_81268_1 [Eumeta japonica]|uniref:Uncharacterized protein n=1 Tax=Eumeta variegata TaxID=151549 RepID=A0A4C1WTC7_EUMVA|nr:hypothetical protein EVAR_81268_1 [Eumeta japonica]
MYPNGCPTTNSRRVRREKKLSRAHTLRARRAVKAHESLGVIAPEFVTSLPSSLYLVSPPGHELLIQSVRDMCPGATSCRSAIWRLTASFLYEEIRYFGRVSRLYQKRMERRRVTSELLHYVPQGARAKNLNNLFTRLWSGGDDVN